MEPPQDDFEEKREKVFVKSIMAALILHTRTIERVMLIRTYCHVKNSKFKDMALLQCWLNLAKNLKLKYFYLRYFRKSFYHTNITW